MKPTASAPARASLFLGLSLALTSFISATALTSDATSDASRKLLQNNQCTTNSPGLHFVGESSRNPQACSRCASRGRVAWCCRTDYLASPQTCKLADSNGCCSGPGFQYTYTYPNGEVDRDTLDDVWCMPSTCQAAFDVNAWPVRGGNGGGNGGGNWDWDDDDDDNYDGGMPGPRPPINAPAQCITRNERADFVGEYRNPRNPRRSGNNARICGACKARGQVAWCCNSLYGDMASTDPKNCVRALDNNRCCTGRQFRYRYFDRDDGWDWDTMDDVWCLPASCTAP